MSARVYEYPITLPTHRSVLASQLSPLFEVAKVPLYPYTFFLEPQQPPTLQTYKFWALENAHIRALVAPDFGGRVYSLRDKHLKTPAGHAGPGAELLYDNRSVKPYTIEPRMSWISAGIEFNFPVAHSHTSMERVGSRAYELGDRAYVEVGETERRLGLTWVVRLSLGPDDRFLTQETFLHNPSVRPGKWHLWSNAGVEGWADTEFMYPPANVVVHGSRDEKNVWPGNWSKIGDREGMLGLFWLDQQALYFGAFQHRYGHGLMHLADPAVVPGMKLWTFGKEGTEEWAHLLSDDNRGYAEVQSGAFKTQEEFGNMKPGESAYFIEFWRGAASVKDYHDAPLPHPHLSAPPPRWFGMEHIPEAQVWLHLLAAHRENAPSRIPLYDPAGTDWPPTGLELEAALRWAAEHRKSYRTALGTWLAARGDYKSACAALDETADPFGKRVRGLMAWRYERDLKSARKYFEQAAFTEPGFQLDYDALLAHLGCHADRAAVLAKFERKDYRVLEREADLLVATGKPQDALKILSGNKWPRQHERFIRSDIWRRARAAVGEAADPVPEDLGEDKLTAGAPTPHGTLDGILRKIPELPT